MVSQATIVGSSFRTACKIRETDSTALTQLRETPPLNHSVGGVERLCDSVIRRAEARKNGLASDYRMSACVIRPVTFGGFS
jgi:hypothetical protein